MLTQAHRFTQTQINTHIYKLFFTCHHDEWLESTVHIYIYRYVFPIDRAVIVKHYPIGFNQAIEQ